MKIKDERKPVPGREYVCVGRRQFHIGCVYALYDPYKDVVFYVGNSMFGSRDRFMNHLWHAKHKGASKVSKYINGMEGIPEVIELDRYVYHGYNAGEWGLINNLETYWAAQMKEWGFKLTNQTALSYGARLWDRKLANNHMVLNRRFFPSLL